MFIRASSSGGGGGRERKEKRGNYLLGFSQKKPFKPWPGWPWVGAVRYQALSLFQFLCAIIHKCVKVRKGEGEPGYKDRDFPNSSKVPASWTLHILCTISPLHQY